MEEKSERGSTVISIEDGLADTWHLSVLNDEDLFENYREMVSDIAGEMYGKFVSLRAS